MVNAGSWMYFRTRSPYSKNRRDIDRSTATRIRLYIETQRISSSEKLEEGLPIDPKISRSGIS